jgi:UDP-2,3-diacylglucosamine pyrophosphatase LpxH
VSKYTFAVVGDPHIGSRYCCENELLDFCTYAHKRGAERLFVAGDLLEGILNHSTFLRGGFDDQCRLVSELLPYREGSRYEVITGNHCASFERIAGIEAIAAVRNHLCYEHGRRDFVYHGQRCADVRVPILGHRETVRMVHPNGGAIRSLLPLRRFVECALERPTFLIVGHFHSPAYLPYLGVHILAPGAFQSGEGNFSQSLPAPAVIGGWIVDCYRDDDGRLRVCPEVVEYEPSA